jgi:hypothetical protein
MAEVFLENYSQKSYSNYFPAKHFQKNEKDNNPKAEVETVNNGSRKVTPVGFFLNQFIEDLQVSYK